MLQEGNRMTDGVTLTFTDFQINFSILTLLPIFFFAIFFVWNIWKFYKYIKNNFIMKD